MDCRWQHSFCDGKWAPVVIIESLVDLEKHFMNFSPRCAFKFNDPITQWSATDWDPTINDLNGKLVIMILCVSPNYNANVFKFFAHFRWCCSSIIYVIPLYWAQCFVEHKLWIHCAWYLSRALLKRLAATETLLSKNWGEVNEERLKQLNRGSIKKKLQAWRSRKKFFPN